MNLFKLFTGAAAVALIAATPALAADLIVDVPVDEPVAVADTGWYLSVFGGGVWAHNIEADDGSPDFGQFFDFGADTGWLVGAAVGVRITDNLRGEVEVSTGSLGLNDVTISGGPAAPVDGSVALPLTDGSASTTYLLGNVWFDIDTGAGFTPYVGAGVGVGFVSADAVIGAPLNASVDLSGWGLAYQVGAGVKIDVADNIALDLGYRWKAIVDAEVEGNGNDAVADYGSHVVQAGLTFGF
ncbi:outer membrane beta-barrel protein [Devosia sp. ZB163]|uniref:outer membrane protein n=1 Tax=Devosia sp. ZB163 TaxID=3025938 RepID=UPI002361E052|nr:outer membrane beta-barrel protein [Devosia sp. ZB163]MDC9824029.1 outer membrane beta-barrel protein [Devosia sp. ZB163]